ncbi:MAG: transporter, partial [Planctomycetes bacterium]|nr:transporter [Planctomycetota bacterium]
MNNTPWKVALVILVVPGAVLGGAPEVRKIQDNSFLLEEAYNQEDGVVQHTQTFQHVEAGDWFYSFTQEWPVPTQKHQFSYTIPYLHLDEPQAQTGFGDVLLNYRYQAVLQGPVAFSPRVSLIMPTGNHREGLGNDTWGVQGNLPLSLELGDRWVTHWNLGATYLPGARSLAGVEA